MIQHYQGGCYGRSRGIRVTLYVGQGTGVLVSTTVKEGFLLMYGIVCKRLRGPHRASTVLCMTP